MERLRTIRPVADEVGVHPDTIRRWEREGKIPPAVRRNGLRLYSTADVAKIKAAVFAMPAQESASRA